MATSTDISLLEYSLREKNIFDSLNHLLDLKSRIYKLNNDFIKLRDIIELIDNECKSNYNEKVNKIIDTLISKNISKTTSYPIGLINLIDRSSDLIRIKNFPLVIKIFEDWKIENGFIQENILEVLNFVINIDKSKLSEEALELIDTGKVSYKGKIFISYSFKASSKLIINIIVPLLEKLNYRVYYAPRDFPASESPGKNAKNLIKKSGLLIAFIPKDINLAGNVIHEIGLAGDKKVAIFAETESFVPSNIKTTGTYTTFSNRKIPKLMLDIIDVIIKEGFGNSNLG